MVSFEGLSYSLHRLGLWGNPGAGIQPSTEQSPIHVLTTLEWA